MEQIKGPQDVRQKIIKAAEDAKKHKDYPIELRCHDVPYITEKYEHKILPPTHGAYSSIERK